MPTAHYPPVARTGWDLRCARTADCGLKTANCSLTRQMNSKRRPLPKLRMLDKNLPLVVVFNDTLRQTEAQAPSTRLGGKARLKYDFQL